MLENKCSIIEASEGLKAGMFVAIHGYINAHGEKQNAIVHADANYQNTHQRSAEMLDQIESDPEFSVSITRNAWIDPQGQEHTRKAKGRTLRTGITETVTRTDADFQAAIDRVRKGIIDPRKITDNFEKIARSLYENDNTGKVYLRNVLVHAKTVTKEGVYEPVCSERSRVIADAIRSKLPVGEYRSYILDDEMIDLPDGTKAPRFEWVSLMGESVSSSTSSGE